MPTRNIFNKTHYQPYPLYNYDPIPPFLNQPNNAPLNICDYEVHAGEGLVISLTSKTIYDDFSPFSRLPGEIGLQFFSK